jgi:hypothetical protein
MRTPILLLFAMATSFVSSSGNAQSTLVLVPIVTTNATGAFGSAWTSEAAVFNNSTVRIAIGFDDLCSQLCTVGTALEPLSGTILRIAVGSVPAALIRVPVESADSVEFALRVRDVSRQSDSWGAEVPVVREDRSYRQSFDLLNIPLQPRFRQTLRIYDFEDKSGASVRVQYYDMTTGQLLKESLVALLAPSSTDVFTPAYLQSDLFTQLGDLAGVDRLRVRISPTSDTQHLWAMVSVTNNVTQEVTMITPQ